MAVKTRAQLKAENAADFPDNVTRLISPADLRGQMDDVVDSAVLPEDLASYGLAGAVKVVASSTYTLTNSDRGVLLYFTSPEFVLVGLPVGLSSNFSCRLVQGNAQITVIPEVGVTFVSANSKFSSVRYELLDVVAIAADSYVLLGITTDRELVIVQPPPTNTQLPTITQQGSRLVADRGLWITGEVLTEFFYSWQRDALPVDGITTDFYDLTDADIGGSFTVAVRAVNEFGEATASSLPTAPIVASLPVNSALPTIAGVSSPPQVGETATVTLGTWSGIPSPAFAEQWKSAGVAVSGAVQISYRIRPEDIGNVITVTETATNSAGSISATSLATAAVVAAPGGTAPVLTLFSVAPAPNVSETAVSLEVTTNQGDGIFYWVILADGATAPNATQIRNGTDGAGNPAPFKGSIEVASIETWGTNPSGLSPGSAYDPYGVMYGATGLASNIVTDEFSMGGGVIPVLTTQAAIDFSDVFAWLSVSTNNNTGTLYIVTVPEADPTPSAAQIKLGQNSAGAAAPSGNQAVTSVGIKTQLVRGLVAATAYKACFVHNVTAGDSAIVTATFKTDTLILAIFAGGLATDMVPTSSILTGAQPDPFGGNNAVKWNDNGTTGQTVSMSRALTYLNGLNKLHFSCKWESRAAWVRVYSHNITIFRTAHFNVQTGAVGTEDWEGVPATFSLPNSWFMYSGVVNVAPGPDVAGSISFYMGDANNTTLVAVRDTTNIRYMWDVRITRVTL